MVISRAVHSGHRMVFWIGDKIRGAEHLRSYQLRCLTCGTTNEFNGQITPMVFAEGHCETLDEARVQFARTAPLHPQRTQLTNLVGDMLAGLR